MNHLPFYSKKRTSQHIKTEPVSSQKKYVLLKQFSNSKNPLELRDSSPLATQMVKSVPKNIIYDKQTLYMEVQELKKTINNLIQENTKLKTRLAIIQTQKERFNKSKQKQQNEEKHVYQPYFAISPTQLKLEAIKNESLRRQLKQVIMQLQIYKKQNIRIKRSIKYSKQNELQIQLNMIIDQNKHLISLYQQLRMKVQGDKTASNSPLENQFNKICKENKLYLAQIENLNVEIMNLQNQLRIEKAQKLSKERSLKNEMSEEKRLTAIKLKQIINFRRQNSSLIDSRIRSFRAKEKLQQSSFKSHHVHIQPIRKNHILNVPTMQKLDQKRGNSDQVQYKINQDVLKMNQRQNVQLGIAQHKLKETQEKVKAQTENHIEPKPSAVPTFFSQNPDKDNTIKQKQKLQLKAAEQSIKQSLEENLQRQQIQCSETKPITLQAIQVQNQEQFITPTKISSSLNKSQSQLEINDNSSRTIYQAPKINMQYLDQNENMGILNHKNENKQILTEIRQLLGYRFSYQKYRFADLKRDIEASNAKQLSFIDICHMLVNQPFYLNLEYCQVLANFIFEHQRPKHQQKVQITKLLINLGSLIEDFQQLSIEKQFEILQKCIQLVKKNEKQLAMQFQQNRNENNTIHIDKLRQILQKHQFGRQDIQYIITQISINAGDLHHLPYQLIFQRFSISQSARSSKRDIIFQKGEESINSSHNSVLKQTCQNIDSLLSAINIQHQDIQQQALDQEHSKLRDQIEQNITPN